MGRLRNLKFQIETIGVSCLLIFSLACSDATKLSSDRKLEDLNSLEGCNGMNLEACQVYKDINEYRVSQGLSELGLHSDCIAAAQEHTEDMVDNNFFGHDSPDESWRERMIRYDLLTSNVSENIAFAGTPEEATAMWLGAQANTDIILNPNYTSTGVGYAFSRWVQCFSDKQPDI